MKRLTEQQFNDLIELAQQYKGGPLRKGQYVMGCLFNVNKDVYESVTGTAYDPFYLESRLTMFWDCVSPKSSPPSRKKFTIIWVDSWMSGSHRHPMTKKTFVEAEDVSHVMKSVYGDDIGYIFEGFVPTIGEEIPDKASLIFDEDGEVVVESGS